MVTGIQYGLNVDCKKVTQSVIFVRSLAVMNIFNVFVFGRRRDFIFFIINWLVVLFGFFLCLAQALLYLL